MGRDKRAVDIMDATQCRYTVALSKVEKEKKNGSLGRYMEMVDKILENIDNGIEDSHDRCVECLSRWCEEQPCKGF